MKIFLREIDLKKILFATSINKLYPLMSLYKYKIVTLFGCNGKTCLIFRKCIQRKNIFMLKNGIDSFLDILSISFF